MENTRVRIVDIAEELGLSTATVSNVIHGKTKKISDETVKRVQQLLEERQYIPSMAGILLAQNDSRIIGVVINNHEKYEGHVLEDPFVASSLNNLSVEIEQSGYFMMVKTTTDLKDIVKFASMWNLEGIIIIGFCEDEYNKLREFMRIPFVVYDGYFENKGRVCNLTIENFNGGVQMGEYFRNLGHEKALYLSDNMICVDLERYQGFCQGFGTEHVESWSIPMQKHSRHQFYEEHFGEISKYTAVFAASDYYAIDFMQFVMAKGIRVPEDISVSGFDDNPICEQVVPSLTSVRQDGRERAREALS
ncbi:MAG: LacI family DNA-binding transcriptional regulator, partial [Lachnospiraceae bacterium]|nr:LacI family DNA-binding transcriptional regulator [Lachnospiraceae bacterium]